MTTRDDLEYICGQWEANQGASSLTIAVRAHLAAEAKLATIAKPVAWIHPVALVAIESEDDGVRAYSEPLEDCFVALYAGPATLSARDAPQAQVKALVWVRDAANTDFNEYDLATDPRDGVTGLIMKARPRDHLGVYRSSDEAKTAAQADFERRILSALRPSTTEATPVEALVERIARIAEPHAWLDRDRHLASAEKWAERDDPANLAKSFRESAERDVRGSLDKARRILDALDNDKEQRNALR